MSFKIMPIKLAGLFLGAVVLASCTLVYSSDSPSVKPELKAEPTSEQQDVQRGPSSSALSGATGTLGEFATATLALG
jgi:hypothetical protein